MQCFKEVKLADNKQAKFWRKQVKTIVPEVIQLDRIDAVIFDLDGVITDTAKQHAEAWKQMFDQYLRMRSEKYGTIFKSFEDSDYRMYVDGKPRYDGVRDFLASRQISLPYGRKEDPIGRETVCGLGNRKNSYFLKILDEQGAKVYQSSVDLIRALRSSGVKTAIISSSRNCAFILRSTGIHDLFDVKVDGLDLDSLNIRGKPDPSIFLEAAKRLGVRPERSVVIEDALSGVEAGRRGGFALVIGVSRTGNDRQLMEHGAHSVVKDLGEIDLVERGQAQSRNSSVRLPSALQDKLMSSVLASQPIAVFLDYDGTLTEIVEDPAKALMSVETRNTLRELAPLCPIAILSGRDIEDVRRLVNVDGIVYAGCHGFEIMTADGRRHDNPDWIRFLPFIDRAEREFRSSMREIQGVLVERKRFAISVHYRRVDPSLVQEVERRFDAVASSLPQLRKTEGKKVFEVLPNVEWNKGKALLFLMNFLGLDQKGTRPIFVGDDLTDEEAFKVIRDTGTGIVVGNVQRDTFARYYLLNPTEVRMYLENLIAVLKGSAK